MEELSNGLMCGQFYKGYPIYRDQLGWQPEQFREARSFVSKEIFDYEIVRVGLNLSFYYFDNDTFYGLHTERFPIEFKILPRDRTQEFLGDQCHCDTHEDGEVLFSFQDREEIWNGVQIDGKSLEEVLERSFIVGLD